MLKAALDFPLRRLIWLAADLATPIRKGGYSDYRLKLALLRRLGLRIADNVTIAKNFRFPLEFASKISIERFAAIEDNISIFNIAPVTIGAFTAIGPRTVLANGWHRLTDYAPQGGPLVIGKGCFIGMGSQVVGAVTIGNNSLISAGATIISDVPEATVMAGVPAKIVGRRPLPKAVWLYPDQSYDPRNFEVIPKPDA